MVTLFKIKHSVLSNAALAQSDVFLASTPCICLAHYELEGKGRFC